MGTLTLRREDGRIVCERVAVADRAHRRMRGLMGRRRLNPGQGMVLRPAFAIHTHFMHFPIDVVFLDSDQVVIAIEKQLKPWRTASCRGAREVVELPAGECDRRGLEIGDRVAWASRSAADVRADSTGSLWDDTPEPRGRVLVVSRDARFVKLARFLFEGRDLEVEELNAPERLSDAIRDPDVDGLAGRRGVKRGSRLDAERAMTTDAGTQLRGALPAERARIEAGERLERLHAYFLEGCPDSVRPALDGVLASARLVRDG